MVRGRLLQRISRDSRTPIRPRPDLGRLRRRARRGQSDSATSTMVFGRDLPPRIRHITPDLRARLRFEHSRACLCHTGRARRPCRSVHCHGGKCSPSASRSVRNPTARPLRGHSGRRSRHSIQKRRPKTQLTRTPPIIRALRLPPRRKSIGSLCDMSFRWPQAVD